MHLLPAVLVTILVLCFMTQVVVKDEIFDVPRDKVLHWLGSGGTFKQYLHQLLSCPRCAGVWLSPFATCLVLQQWPWDDWSDFAIVFAAASYGQWALMEWVVQFEDE